MSNSRTFKIDETKIGCTNFMKGVASFSKFITKDILQLYDISNFTYYGAHTPSQIICKRCKATLNITPANFKSGKSCGKCNYNTTINNRKLFKQIEIIRKFIRRHHSKFNYSDVIYNKASDKIIITCRFHSYQFKSTYKNHLRHDSGGCHLCEKDKLRELRTTHGLRHHRLYNTWAGIKARCLNPKNPAYPNYGGRGIDICKEWLNFKVFYDWSMKNGYQDHLQIDRINNDKGYKSGNCRFVTSKKNSNNKSTSNLIDLDGEIKTLQEWCEEYNMNPKTVCKRISRGWSVENAIKKPVIVYSNLVKKKYRLVEPLWSGIKNRCNNKNSLDYKNYGRKGIRMNQGWSNDYKCFEDWCLTNGYKKGLHLHRINNNKGYEPENCKFVTAWENAQHKSSNRYLIFNGERKTISQFAREAGLKRETIFGRLKRGYSVEEALKLPLGFKRKNGAKLMNSK